MTSETLNCDDSTHVFQQKHFFSLQTKGHQHGPRGHQVARTDHVDHPRACPDNSINMISIFTLMDIFNFY